MIIDLSSGIEQNNPFPDAETLKDAQPYEVFENKAGDWLWKDYANHVMFYEPSTGHIYYIDDNPGLWEVVRYIGKLGKKS